MFGRKRIARLEWEISQLTGENKSLKDDIETFTKANDQIAGEYSILSTKMSERTRQNAALKEEALSKSAQIDSQMKMRDADAEKLVAAREEVYLKQAKIEELEAEFTSLLDARSSDQGQIGLLKTSLFDCNNQVDEYEMQQIASLGKIEELGAEIATLVDIRNANEGLCERNSILEQGNMDLHARINELCDELDEKDEIVDQFKRKSEDLAQNLCLMDDRLGEAQGDACEMTRLRDEANGSLDRCQEWIGEFTKRSLRYGKVNFSDLRLISEGWETPDGRYPWDEE